MITKEMLDVSDFRVSAHYTKGYDKSGFMGGSTEYVCEQHPRFRIRRHTGPDMKTTHETYRVDGIEHENLETALIALNTPVVLYADERAFLDKLTQGIIYDYRAFVCKEAGVEPPGGTVMLPDDPRYPVEDMIQKLLMKGAVGFKPVNEGNGFYRRVP